MTAHRGIGLRLVLALLALAIIAPLALVAVFVFRSSWAQQRVNVERQNIETARAISVAIDQEVQNTMSSLSLIAGLELFDTTALNGFEELARRVVPRQLGWHAMLLAGDEGRTMVNTAAFRPGDPPQSPVDWAGPVLATGSPTVSNLIKRPGFPGYFVIVAVPVVRRGVVTFVLGAELETLQFTRVLLQQNVPPDGVITLLDRNRHIIARTRGEAEFVGKTPSPGFFEAAGRMAQGSWRERLLEGEPAYASLSRSLLTGWTVGIGLPAATVEGPIRRNLWMLIAAALAALGLALALAAWFARAFTRSFQAASHAAMALARSEPALLPQSRIREVNVLGAGLRDAAAALQARLHERDEAERLKDEFLMTLSHELRTPLTAIAGWSRMLASGQIREGQERKAIASIERNASSLTQLVDDLLDVSRSVSGKLRIDVQPVDVAGVVQAAIDSVRPAADAKEIEIHTAYDAGQTMVLGDINRLRQVVWNLLSNAVKFTPGGGSVQVSVARVTGPDAGNPAGMIDIAVSDTGQGIDATFLPFVFDRFRQGSGGPSRPHGGLGLGLAIVRQLVELHGGTVHAGNNTPAPGATFRVRLPALTGATDRRSIPAATGGATAIGEPVRLDRLSILVVDDEPQARELFVSILEYAGAEVRAASSVEDAMFLLQAWSPQVLLSDIEMPHEDGYSLIRKVGSLGGQRPIAIAVTAHARPEDRLRALEAGFQWHLGKPIDPMELVSVVATLAGRMTNTEVAQKSW